MIRKEDEQMAKNLKQALGIAQKWEYVELIDRMLSNLKKAPQSYKYAPEGTNFYTADCPKCGWWGSSELLDGGGQIADTGDYDDCYCPVCGSTELNEKEPDDTKCSCEEQEFCNGAFNKCVKCGKLHSAY